MGILREDINYAKKEFSELADQKIVIAYQAGEKLSNKFTKDNNEKIDRIEKMTNELFQKFSKLAIGLTAFVVVTVLFYIKKMR